MTRLFTQIETRRKLEAKVIHAVENVGPACPISLPRGDDAVQVTVIKPMFEFAPDGWVISVQRNYRPPRLMCLTVIRVHQHSRNKPSHYFINKMAIC